MEISRACMMRRLMAAMLPTVTWDHPRAKLVLFSIVVSISFIVASPAGIAPGTVTVQAAPAGGMLTIFALYFNSRHITRFFRSDNSTRIHVTGLEVAVTVTETPEEILRLIQA